MPVAASRRGELFYDPGAERRQVVRPAAGGDVLVGDHLLVDHVAAGVADVGPDAWVGGQGAALDDAGLDKRPRAMADHADRLAAINKVADEADGRLVLAQIVGIDRFARQDEGVVVASRCLADQPVYGESDRRVKQRPTWPARPAGPAGERGSLPASGRRSSRIATARYELRDDAELASVLTYTAAPDGPAVWKILLTGPGGTEDLYGTHQTPAPDLNWLQAWLTPIIGSDHAAELAHAVDTAPPRRPAGDSTTTTMTECACRL